MYKKMKENKIIDKFFKENFDDFVDCYDDGSHITYFKRYSDYDLCVRRYDDKIEISFLQGGEWCVDIGNYTFSDLQMLMKILK